jgi:hypothetical protein
MKWKTEKLQQLGFRRVATTKDGGQAWIRLKLKKMVAADDDDDEDDAPSEWAVGQLVLFWPRFATQLQVAVDMTLCRLEALGALADDPEFQAQAEMIRMDPEVSGGGFLKALKKFGKGFKKKVNQVAGAIAKNKIINKLRQAYIKVIKGPIGDLGVELGARALSAFGVPAAATKLAINQRRFAQIDRLKKGGWAGMVQRATGKEGLKGVLKEAAQRQLMAGKESLKRVLPGGLDITKLAGAANKKMAESSVSGDWGWLNA